MFMMHNSNDVGTRASLVLCVPHPGSASPHRGPSQHVQCSMPIDRNTHWER